MCLTRIGSARPKALRKETTKRIKVLRRGPIGIAIFLALTRLAGCRSKDFVMSRIFKLVENQRLRVDSFFYPCLDRLPQFAQATFEKMIRAVNDCQSFGL